MPEKSVGPLYLLGKRTMEKREYKDITTPRALANQFCYNLAESNDEVKRSLVKLTETVVTKDSEEWEDAYDESVNRFTSGCFDAVMENLSR